MAADRGETEQGCRSLLPADAPVLVSAGGWWMNVKAAEHMDEASPPYLDLAAANDFDTRQW